MIRHRIVRHKYGPAIKSGGKLYDYSLREIVTLSEVRDFIVDGEEVEITDKITGKDLLRESMFRMLTEGLVKRPSVAELTFMIRKYLIIEPKRTCSCACHSS